MTFTASTRATHPVPVQFVAFFIFYQLVQQWYEVMCHKLDSAILMSFKSITIGHCSRFANMGPNKVYVEISDRLSSSFTISFGCSWRTCSGFRRVPTKEKKHDLQLFVVGR